MNILFTLNKKYINLLFTCLLSIGKHHKNDQMHFHIVSNDIVEEDLEILKKELSGHYKYTFYSYTNDVLENAKTTYRYPQEIYYRLFAKCYLKDDVDRILYLDVDTIVIKNLRHLYKLNFEDKFFIGSTNIKKALTKFNNIKNKATYDSHYLNTGVLLINVEGLRKNQDIDLLNEYIIKHDKTLFLPDQDVLNALYGNKVKLVDHLLYNLSDRALMKHNFGKANKIDLDWVNKNSCIIHYYGKNKPWNEKYKGILSEYYFFYENYRKKLVETI
ncbi:Glycosyl transferase, family 8 [Alteracholeplasma palmae J233]|uniref:Glycosyl transferase, family 8 n=1 Tax=Alteracholeplasma palmae (strain ATCC 49389 / J233) TaxID=1318466 RepID=U4KQC1_ALTPJ|nr:Glycosyl transferase, family 8 [Alteracholeplasma palmae J233]